MKNNVIEHLETIFNNVNNWLNFAEAKNAALIAINATLLFNLLSKPPENYGFDIETVLFLGTFLFLSISFFISLISFNPVIKIRMPKSDTIAVKTGKSNSINLLFYGHIAGLSDSRLYLEQLKNALIDNDSNFSKIELDYAEQIKINSIIANDKYLKFKYSLFVFVVGAFFFLIYGIFNH